MGNNVGLFLSHFCTNCFAVNEKYYQGLSIDWIRKEPYNCVTVIIYFTTETNIGMNNRVGTFHNACSNTTSLV